MIVRLMRQHFAPPMAIAISLFFAVNAIKLPELAIPLGLPFFYLIWRAMPKRGSRFETGLPIHGRQIALARLFSTLLLVLIPLVAWVSAQLLNGHSALSTLRLLEYLIIATLAVLLPFTLQAGEITEPAAWKVAATWALLAAVSALILNMMPAIAGLIVLTFAVAATCYVLLAATPAALQVASIEPSTRAASDHSMSPELSPQSASAAAWRIVLRSMFTPRTLIWIPIVTLVSWLGTPFVYLFVATMSLAGILRYRMRWMSALPLSTRRRLALLLVPCLLVTVACLLIGQMLPTAPFLPRQRPGEDSPTSSHDTRYRQNRTQVPLEFWSRVRDGRDPIIAAPWGETVEADTISILGIMLANPFSTDAQSSRHFVEWQFERATGATLGHPMTMASYDSSADVPPIVRMPRRLQVLSAGTMLSALLLLLFMTELGHWYVLNRQQLIPRLGDIVSFASIAVVMGIYFYYLLRRNVNVITAATEWVLRWLSNVLPQNIVIVVLAAAAPVVLSYAMLEWQFGRAELTARIKADAA